VPAALGLLAPWLCRRQGLPVITLLHNITETVKLENIGLSKGGLAAKLMLQIGRVLTRFILKSDLVGLTISQYVGIIRQAYKVKHAVLLPHGSFDLPERIQLPDNPGTYKLLAFGKFGTYKKAEVLLEALPILRQRYPHKQFRITIAGTDNPNVKGYIDRLQTQYRHDPDVVFTGYVPEEEVAALFQSATLIVFPYTATTGSSGILHQAGSYARKRPAIFSSSAVLTVDECLLSCLHLAPQFSRLAPRRLPFLSGKSRVLGCRFQLQPAFIQPRHSLGLDLLTLELLRIFPRPLTL
jgi:glycosyltransferase involved in cell wall biosynthesis